MCGRARFKFDGHEVFVYIGDYGPWLRVDDMLYAREGSSEFRERFIKHLEGFTKAELIEMIVGFVDNGEEG